MAQRNKAIRKINTANGVQYEFLTDVGVDPVTGKRRQSRKRFRTEREAREAMADIQTQRFKGTYVPRKKLTVAEAADDYLEARHNLRPSSLNKLRYDLATLTSFYGDMALQQLTKPETVDG
jgi:hypothetical protein